MTLKQETADIIEKFADKSLTEGCLVLTEYDVKKTVVRDTDFYVEWAGKMREDERPFVYNVQEDKSGDKVYLKKIIGHPVMIGTVFAKYYGDNPCPNKDLYALWCDCGIDKSLNEIFEGELITHNCSEVVKCAMECVHTDTSGERLKDPNAQALLEFIKTL